MSIKRLYKFGRVNEYREQFFSEGSLWFSSAANLNDPFECSPQWRFVDETDKVWKDEIERFEDASPGASAAHGRALMHRLAYQRLEVLDVLRDFFTPLILNNVGICCFTEQRDIILMWSHYAAEHTGYCVEFEVTDQTPFFRFAQQVCYVDAYPELKWFNTSDAERTRLTFLTKFKEWSYEKEWRILDPSGPGPRAYPKELMKSITFGLRMKKEQKEIIKRWVSQRSAPLRYYQAQKANDQFELTFENLE